MSTRTTTGTDGTTTGADGTPETSTSGPATTTSGTADALASTASAAVRTRESTASGMANAPVATTSGAVDAPAASASVPAAMRTARRFAVPVAALGLLAAIALSLTVGARTTSVPEVIAALTAPDGSEASLIVWDMRLPRTISGLLVGAALGAAGALMQAFSRNPLADPGILGVNAGAALAVTIAVGALGLRDVSATVYVALPGALLATAAVWLIGAAGRGPASPLRLTLAGVALGAVLSGLAAAIRLSDPHTFAFMLSWAAGSLAGHTLGQSAAILPFVLAGLAAALLCARSLNLIALGDDLAAAMGVPVALVRVITVLAVTVLAGAATALAGPIAFIGLMIPHLVRWVLGPHQVWIIGLSALCGPVLILTADALARVAAAGELPVGVVTAVLGAPMLIILVRRRGASGL